MPDQGLREREDLFDMLFGKDRTTGGDAAHKGDVDGLFRLDGIGIARISDFKGAAFGGVLADKTFIDQGFDLVFDRGGGGEASCLADLAHGWGIAVGLDRLLDDIEDQLLAGGQAIDIGWAIGQFRDGCRGRGVNNVCGLIFCAHGLRVGHEG